MSRIILMAMVLAVTVAGCNRFPDNGLQINSNLLPDDGCLVRGNQEERLLRGLLDTSYRIDGVPRDYVVALGLTSYLVSNALEFQGEQNNIQVDNFDITILLPDGSKPDLGGLANPYRVTTSAVIPATTPGSVGSTEVGAATGIPGNYIDPLLAVLPEEQRSVVLDIRAGGTTFGGFSQRSAPFRWPVDFCDGCLLACEAENIAESCLPGQDVWPWCPAL